MISRSETNRGNGGPGRLEVEREAPRPTRSACWRRDVAACQRSSHSRFPAGAKPTSAPEGFIIDHGSGATADGKPVLYVSGQSRVFGHIDQGADQPPPEGLTLTRPQPGPAHHAIRRPHRCFRRCDRKWKRTGRLV